jgi:hypothetical protein
MQQPCPSPRNRTAQNIALLDLFQEISDARYSAYPNTCMIGTT